MIPYAAWRPDKGLDDVRRNGAAPDVTPERRQPFGPESDWYSETSGAG